MLSTLHTVRSYPLDLDEPVLAHYPAMKLGHRPSLLHYAGLLAPLARAIVAQSAGERAWTVTSPAFWGLPCAANLLTRVLYAELSRNAPEGVDIVLEEMTHNCYRPPIGSADDFALYNDYSKLDARTRAEVHRQFDYGMTYDAEKIGGRNVIFVNDCNVTGAQLDLVVKQLADSGLKSLHWLLIVDVVRDVGRRFPQLESEINNFKLFTPDAVIAFLQNADFQYTGKLAAKLMAWDAPTLARVLDALNGPARAALYRAVREDRIYEGEFFAEKLGLLARAAESGRELEACG